jgi:circadian clock protein KaiC
VIFREILDRVLNSPGKDEKNREETGAREWTDPRDDASGKSRDRNRRLRRITFGGLPRGRASLICGSAGSGKTLFATQFLVNGARLYSEPGVLVTFEETREELTINAESLRFDIADLCRRKLLTIDNVQIEPHETAETGEYDLEGLFVRIRHAIEQIKARRIVLDTIETLFSGFANEAVLRSEIHRLFQFLKSFGVTAIITGERGRRRSNARPQHSAAITLDSNRISSSANARQWKRGSRQSGKSSRPTK